MKKASQLKPGDSIKALGVGYNYGYVKSIEKTQSKDMLKINVEFLTGQSFTWIVNKEKYFDSLS